MFRSRGSLLAVVVTLLVCCSAENHQDSEQIENNHIAENYEGQPRRNPKPGSNSLLREARDTHGYGLLPYFMARRHDYASGVHGGKRDQWPTHGFFSGEGYLKRNFDEIDLSGLNNFVKKRNMDEIDQTLMPFPHAKRSYHPFTANYMSYFDKKKYQPDYPMDEIDLSQFPIGSKRSTTTF